MTHQVPQGFQLAGVHAGIKQASTQNDISLFVAANDAVAAGVYTTNLVHAASIDWNQAITPAENCRALVINSGNANACTGERGAKDNAEMAQLVASAIGADSSQVLVLSTGIIGEFIPMDKMRSGTNAAVKELANGPSAVHAASEGIMTTDTKEKIVSKSLDIGEDNVRILGLAKGAGMIGPNMATMLCVLLTDAKLDSNQAQRMLKTATDHSFNCVSVDGHMSTSDAAIMLSSGAGAKINAIHEEIFERELQVLCQELARMVAGDGEGTSHLVTIEVTGCKTVPDAQKIAKTIANSALVKTAISGNDPNWGRIVSAAGYAGVEFDVSQCKLSINGTPVFADGMPTDFDAARLSQLMKANWETEISISFGEGEQGCRFWTSDLTAEYVRINADYHT